MDIEWCRDGDRSSSCRPGRSPPAIDRDPWNDSRAGDFLWTNTNVGEAIPDVMTPATWSMVQVFLSDAMATASIPPYRRLRPDRRPDLPQRQCDDDACRGRLGVGEKRFRSLTEEVFGRLPD